MRDGHASPKTGRSFTPFLLLFFVIGAVTLAATAAVYSDNHRRLDEAFDKENTLASDRLTQDFSRHLDQIAEDARLLADIVWEAKQDDDGPDSDLDKALSAGMRALSQVVKHCRGMAVTRGGRRVAMALSSEEDRYLSPWLEKMTRQAFADPPAATRLVGPYPVEGHDFFAQVQPLPAGILVTALDARPLFETMQHRRPDGARGIVLDGNGTLWVGCGSASTCQEFPAAYWRADPDLRNFLDRRGPRVPTRLQTMLSLSPTTEFAAHFQSLPETAASLVLGLLTPRTELMARRHEAWWRLFSVTVGGILCFAVVGMFVWRQRQRERMMVERLEHAEALGRLEHQLVRAEKLATVGVLTAGLAHEVGTPLAIIRGRAEILGDKTGRPEAATILEQSDRIAATLRQVLDFSREQPVACRYIPVEDAFHQVADLLGFRLRQKSIALDIGPVATGLAVAADPDQLQQVLVNLVMNAMDACAPGGRVSLSGRHEAPGKARIEVADTGRGIPPDQLDAVFDPFFTTKPKGEGTGLGLPVVASIVRNHQAQISLRSTPDKGTTVSLIWPTDTGAPA